MKDIPIIMIAAMNKLGYIGNEDGDLICNSRYDLQHFRERSDNGVLIMGRKTYESLPKALPNRTCVVVSSAFNLEHPEGTQRSQVLQVGKIENALEAARRVAERKGHDKIVIAGGTNIFAHFLYEIEELYLTRFEDETVGGARFPDELLEKMIASERLVSVGEKTVYDGELGVTFQQYEAPSPVEWVRGDFVKLCNGIRFRLSEVSTIIPTPESVLICSGGTGVEVREDDAHQDHLLKELDRLIELSGEPEICGENTLPTSHLRVVTNEE